MIFTYVRRARTNTINLVADSCHLTAGDDNVATRVILRVINAKVRAATYAWTTLSSHGVDYATMDNDVASVTAPVAAYTCATVSSFNIYHAAVDGK